MPQAETSSPGLGDEAAIFCIQSAPELHISGQAPTAARGEKPPRALQAFRCGFVQRMPKRREANSPAFAKQKHHEGHAAKRRRSAPAFPPAKAGNRFFSLQIPSAPQIIIGIKIPLPGHLLDCPECEHVGKERSPLRISPL